MFSTRITTRKLHFLARQCDFTAPYLDPSLPSFLPFLQMANSPRAGPPQQAVSGGASPQPWGGEEERGRTAPWPRAVAHLMAAGAGWSLPAASWSPSVLGPWRGKGAAACLSGLLRHSPFLFSPQKYFSTMERRGIGHCLAQTRCVSLGWYGFRSCCWAALLSAGDRGAYSLWTWMLSYVKLRQAPWGGRDTETASSWTVSII